MSIREYTVDGKTYYKAYIGKVSKQNPEIRVQRSISGLQSKAAAIREEKKLLEIVILEIERLEGKGKTWDFVINRWVDDAKSGYIGNYTAETIMDYRAALRKWTRHWLNEFACDLGKAEGRRLIRSIEESEMSMSFVKKLKNTINVVYNYGIEEGIIKGVQNSPVYGLKVSIKKEKVPDILSMDEARKLLYEAKKQSHPWYHIWAVALFTGMRNGELYALEWSDVHSKINGKNLSGDNEHIIVSKSYSKRTNTTKETKAGYWRNIPISPQLHEVLLELYELRGDEKYVLPRIREWAQGRQAKALKVFCTCIGLTPIKFHALRACFATLMLSLGTPPITVMKICGWRDLDTMAHYIRLAGLDEKGATDKLDLIGEKPLSDSEAMANVISLYS